MFSWSLHWDSPVQWKDYGFWNEIWVWGQLYFSQAEIVSPGNWLYYFEPYLSSGDANTYLKELLSLGILRDLWEDLTQNPAQHRCSAFHMWLDLRHHQSWQKSRFYVPLRKEKPINLCHAIASMKYSDFRAVKLPKRPVAENQWNAVRVSSMVM